MRLACKLGQRFSKAYLPFNSQSDVSPENTIEISTALLMKNINTHGYQNCFCRTRWSWGHWSNFSRCSKHKPAKRCGLISHYSPTWAMRCHSVWSMSSIAHAGWFLLCLCPALSSCQLHPTKSERMENLWVDREMVKSEIGSLKHHQ